MWAAVEVLCFGTLSQMFELWSDSDCKAAVARSFKGFTSWDKFQSVLHAFSVLRNICAHHGRLWNRRVPVTPVMLKQVIDKHEKRSIYNNTVWADVIMIQFYVDSLKNNTEYSDAVARLLTQSALYLQGIKSPYQRPKAKNAGKEDSGAASAETNDEVTSSNRGVAG
ncbi:hypothetical protein KIMH_05180 [Bombiscardovia apis]|uniref:Abi-like protein n=2 Tax=Bombiscardovia apis TaxID=2932182 RepID=A0ABM8BBW2_9BIFI|nr:hypothetical protein KIMH_05180 [Bombiscardovia apis]